MASFPDRSHGTESEADAPRTQGELLEQAGGIIALCFGVALLGYVLLAVALGG